MTVEDLKTKSPKNKKNEEPSNNEDDIAIF